MSAITGFLKRLSPSWRRTPQVSRLDRALRALRYTCLTNDRLDEDAIFCDDGLVLYRGNAMIPTYAIAQGARVVAIAVNERGRKFAFPVTYTRREDSPNEIHAIIARGLTWAGGPKGGYSLFGVLARPGDVISPDDEIDNIAWAI